MSQPITRHALLIALLLPVAVIAQVPPRDGAQAQNTVPAGKGIIRGTVTAADTGRPILRAEVRISSTGLLPPDSRVVLTDEKGRFEATALRAGRYGVTASKAGYLNLSYGQIRARHPALSFMLNVSMPIH